MLPRIKTGVSFYPTKDQHCIFREIPINLVIMPPAAPSRTKLKNVLDLSTNRLPASSDDTHVFPQSVKRSAEN